MQTEGKYCHRGHKGTFFTNEASTTTTAAPVHERSDIECGTLDMTVFLPTDLLPEDRNITWREDTCLVKSNGTHYVDKIYLFQCGTTVEIEKDTVTFSNDLIVHTADDPATTADDSDVTYGEGYETVIPVKCIYPRRNNVSTSYMPVKQNVRFFEKRYGQLDITMQQFDTEDFDKPVPMEDYPIKIPLDNDVFIRLGLNINTNDLRLKVDHCIATSTPSPADLNWRQLIQSGCPVNSVRLLSDGGDDDKDIKFSFKAFDFRHNASGFIYIHCEVSVCSMLDTGCSMGCPARTRRAAHGNRYGGSHLVSTGPLLVSNPDTDNQHDIFTMSTVLAAVCLVVAMAATVFAIIGWTKKSKFQQRLGSI